jgi:predicted ABC-type transport system involved in lysophospholipase L1 biosynthesis ATPase subunit
MPTIHLSATVDVEETPRVQQVSGLFDVPPTKRSAREWAVEVPDVSGDWQVGLVVGASGSGKSTLAREAWPDAMVSGYDWPANKSLLDGFNDVQPVKKITSALSSVGFSTPPSWLRPFRCLSNGEQFRATLARALCEQSPLIVFDEFTSVVDRTVAKVGSAAVAKAVRRQPGRKFVAVTCHEDVAEWLCPDWIIEMPSGKLTRRLLRRPSIELEIVRVHRSAWELFKSHHYLDTSLSNAAQCFAALWNGRPVAFTATIHRQCRVCYYAEHRTVCLPDFQGVGIGNAMSEFCAGVMKAKGKPYRSVTGNPAMMRHRARSPLWKLVRNVDKQISTNKSAYAQKRNMGRSSSSERLTAGFEYLGPARIEDARRLGILDGSATTSTRVVLSPRLGTN